MRFKKSFQIFVSSLILIAFFVSPIFYAKVAEAQTTSTSISGYIQGLAPVIMKLPGCKKVINKGVNGLFSGIKNLFSSKSSSSTSSITKISGGGDFVPVSLINKQEEALKKTSEATQNQDQNQNCLNAIGKSVAKILIDKITLSIIDWIQTGDEGGPLFVQDPGKFFEDIGKREILGFGMEIQDPDLYPFAKSFMQGVANTYKNKFAMNAQYSLDTLIAKQTPEFSAQSFSLDFTQGGWGAWEAYTQYPQNNPVGFYVMASDELQRRLEGTFQSTAQLAQQTLAQGSGFLGQERCADPLGVTKEENEDALRGSTNMYSTKNYQGAPRLCKRWEYVTPGKLISEELVSAVQKKDNALLDVETLNDAVAAILDAVLNRFVNGLQNKDVGLAGLDVDTTISNNGTDDFGSSHRVEQDFSSSQIASSTWLEQHPDFDIRTDFNQALIDEQRIYIDKLEQQNKELYSTIDGKVYSIDPTTGKSNAYGLIPTIHQLDYCVPGPHPGWEEDAQNNLEDTKNKIIDTTGMDFLQIGKETGRSANVGSIIMTVSTLLGIADSSSIDSWAKWLGTGQAHCGGNVSISECVSRQYYQEVIDGLINIKPEIVDDNLMQSYGQAVDLLDRIYDQYVKAIRNVYILQILPDVTSDNVSEYNKIPDYQEIFDKNKLLVPTMRGIVDRLAVIKNEIDTLNDDLAQGRITKETYEGENGIKKWLPAFARLSSQLVSGDDIANVDNRLKEIIDEKDHIYKDLLKGPNGCETQLEEWAKDPSMSLMPPQISSSMQNRPDYPLPILYKYPDTAGNDPLLKAFLYYGVYSSAPSWVHPSEATNATALCKFYEKYGEDTSRCGDVPGNITGMLGPNVIHIGDLFNWDGDQTRLMKNYFEKNVIKIY